MLVPVDEVVIGFVKFPGGLYNAGFWVVALLISTPGICSSGISFPKSPRAIIIASDTFIISSKFLIASFLSIFHCTKTREGQN